MWRDLYRYRELLWMLAWRDIRVRYKNSALGAAWAVLPPLATAAVFVFVFQRALAIDDDRLTHGAAAPYALFAFAGLAPWAFLASSLGAGVQSLVANRPLLTKVRFPREVFPFAATLSALVDFLVSLIAFVVLCLWFDLTTSWDFRWSWALVLLPAVVLVQTLLVAGLSLLLAMANLYYRDVGFVLRGVLPLWMFVSNVLYELRSANPVANALILANPMTALIRAYRTCVFGGDWRACAPAMVWAALCPILLSWAWLWFDRRQHEFAEVA